MKYPVTFRIWDTEKNCYTDSWLPDIVQTRLDKYNNFYIQSSSARYILEPGIYKTDVKNKQIYVGDVLMKLTCVNILKEDTEKLTELHKHFDVECVVDNIDKDSIPSLEQNNYIKIYIRTYEYSTPLAKMNNNFWLSGETTNGGFENPKNWVVIGNTHNKKWEFMRYRTLDECYYRSNKYKSINPYVVLN